MEQKEAALHSCGYSKEPMTIEQVNDPFQPRWGQAEQ